MLALTVSFVQMQIVRGWLAMESNSWWLTFICMMCYSGTAAMLWDIPRSSEGLDLHCCLQLIIH